MNKQAPEPKGAKLVVEGLDLIRQPFPAHQISKLPKPTKKQTDDLRDAMNRKDFSIGVRCEVCWGYHHKDVIHLDYVGHAALTDRLLDCDPEWNWEPVAFTADGLPALDKNGGMWIKLTVCGVTRLGYGDAAGKQGGDAVKEIIGDALRNAAMRFGAALDLWHKGDLHADEPHEERPPEKQNEAVEKAKEYLSEADSFDELKRRWEGIPTDTQRAPAVIKAKDDRKAALGKPATEQKPIIDDEIPY